MILGRDGAVQEVDFKTDGEIVKFVNLFKTLVSYFSTDRGPL